MEGEGEEEGVAVAVEEGREAARPQVQEEEGLCWLSWRFFSGPPGARELERRKRERLKILSAARMMIFFH